MPHNFILKDRLDFKRTSLDRCVKIICISLHDDFTDCLTTSICQSILQSGHGHKTMLNPSSFIDFTKLFIKQNWKIFFTSQTSLQNSALFSNTVMKSLNYKLTIVWASKILNLHVLPRVFIPTITPGVKLYMNP